MRKNFTLVVILMLLNSLIVVGQVQHHLKDLRPQWLVFNSGKYEPYQESDRNISTIYFRLDVLKYHDDELEISSSQQFDLFIDGKLAADAERILLNIDSLQKIYGNSSLLIGVHQQRIRPGGIQTVIDTSKNDDGILHEEKLLNTSFRDFAIIAGLMLMVMVASILQLNPKLASDYFSVTKIFWLREGDDNQIYSRLAISGNLLFYIFCSMMLSYYLIIIFHFVPNQYPVALSFQSSTFWEAIWQWLQLSLLLLLIFFAKVCVVYALSFLFGIEGVATIHFFNWIRLLLVVFGILTVALFFYFISHGQSPAVLKVLLKIIAWTLGGWMILIFLKLSRKMNASMFHLFSYICATELIPFLLIIKVLYN